MTDYDIRPTGDPHAYPICGPCYEKGYDGADVTKLPKMAEVRPDNLPHCVICDQPTLLGIYLSDYPERCGVCSMFRSECVCAEQNLR